MVLPLRGLTGRIASVTQVRSTLVASSIRAARERNRLDAYLAALPREHHDAVLNAIAGVWLPMEVATAHYAALETLAIPASEQFDIGRMVADRIQNSVLGTLVKLAHGAGVTPWTAFAQFQRLWDRLLMGGSGAVYKLGPKEARLEAHGVSLAKFEYFRNGWRGMIAGSGELFCNKMYVAVVPERTNPTTVAFRAAWA